MIRNTNFSSTPPTGIVPRQMMIRGLVQEITPAHLKGLAHADQAPNPTQFMQREPIRRCEHFYKS